jgi:hypothetical protein
MGDAALDLDLFEQPELHGFLSILLRAEEKDRNSGHAHPMGRD